MRTREEISQAVNRRIAASDSYHEMANFTLAGIFETLLDIRDLLIEAKNKNHD